MAKKSKASKKKSKSLSDLHPALQALAQYRFGQSREPVSTVKNMVTASMASEDEKRALAQQLTDLLRMKSTLDAKQFACRQLARIGGKENVPALEELLRDPDTADMARYALEPIPAPEADHALLRSLSKVRGDRKIGIINSLGQRKTRSAVPALGELAGSRNSNIAEAALAALARITQ